MNESLTLTRYLYSKSVVMHSIIISMLEHKTDELLFWIYELYFSGFERDVFKLMCSIYNSFYKDNYPKLALFIIDAHTKWRVDKQLHHLIGSIALTLSGKTYSIVHFIYDYYKVKCIDAPCSKLRPNLIINLKPECIEKYKMIVDPSIKTYNVLNNACRFSINNSYNQLFKLVEPDNVRNCYFINWLYYACRSPIWEDRCIDANCEIDDDASKIVFTNEDDEDSFYEKWGYDPDEQPTAVQERFIGKIGMPQIGIRQFCEKFGGGLVTKKLKIITK
jgi:hypothetical protein